MRSLINNVNPRSARDSKNDAAFNHDTFLDDDKRCRCYFPHLHDVVSITPPLPVSSQFPNPNSQLTILTELRVLIFSSGFDIKRSMASSSDSWMKEYNEAVKLADDITGMMSERSSLPASGPETQRHASAIRRKITILGTRLDSLQSLLTKVPTKTEKDMNRRKDMLANLRTKVNQMASTLNMSNFANRDSLLGPEIKADAMKRTVGLDNSGLVGLQRQIMKEQDEGLEKLEETVISTKHIALAVNEELDLHTRLIDDLDQHVDVTDSRLRRVQKNLAVLNKRTKGGCSCLCMLLSVIGIVVLVVVIWLLVKYL
ncbi:hypothetical protein RJT34_00530 [Clitoria ternatea]|uniref:t-SNARE coiled-coil homology domain-containing protein n=1 Tax=Clitoria ternatea TaxID=43366 RepID=A0AAN9PY35_CLITE